jgi:signal transduction histidine kinase
MVKSESQFIPKQFTLEEWNEREYELAEKREELESQKEELNAAIEELVSKNEYLTNTLDELSQRKAELDQLIYRMSHDLRTPVTSILGVCQVMKMEGLPTAFFFHLDHIQKKGYELDSLLKSLTSFSQAALEDFVSEDVYLRKLTGDVLESLKKEKGFGEVEYRFEYMGADKFFTDSSKLYLIIRNIVKNVIDFRPLDRPSVVTLRFSATENELTFECVDNGIGIDAAVLPHIFNMFYRGSERATGAGLGLYIVNLIVKRLKGSIHPHSISGETSFKVVIPHLG